jgi:hypothetical protein
MQLRTEVRVFAVHCDGRAVRQCRESTIPGSQLGEGAERIGPGGDVDRQFTDASDVPVHCKQEDLYPHHRNYARTAFASSADMHHGRPVYASRPSLPCPLTVKSMTGGIATRPHLLRKYLPHAVMEPGILDEKMHALTRRQYTGELVLLPPP